MCPGLSNAYSYWKVLFEELFFVVKYDVVVDRSRVLRVDIGQRSDQLAKTFGNEVDTIFIDRSSIEFDDFVDFDHVFKNDSTIGLQKLRQSEWSVSGQ